MRAGHPRFFGGFDTAEDLDADRLRVAFIGRHIDYKLLWSYAASPAFTRVAVASRVASRRDSYSVDAVSCHTTARRTKRHWTPCGIPMHQHHLGERTVSVSGCHTAHFLLASDADCSKGDKTRHKRMFPQQCPRCGNAWILYRRPSYL